MSSGLISDWRTVCFSARILWFNSGLTSPPDSEWPTMAVPLEKFVQQLEDSGILAGDTIKDFIPPKASPKDAEELARELVRKKKLTKFQAEEVSKGKGKSLVLGNYVLMEKIGAGGMGQVFKARHRVMERLVAVKVLPTAMTKDQAAIARFHREVKAAAKISHPNIVTAYDADQSGGVHFLVMELVEGNDLSALVKQNGPLSVEKAINYVLQAAKGLDAAHKKGIVHRDIKPANLLLDNDGTVKILDMGLARLSLDGDDAPQADLTSTGTIMGTVDYMAPEQALDTKAADARADIYALGCSLYFLLTGKATYDGDTLMKKLLAHREQPIPALRTILPEVSEQLEAVFKKLVAKKVEDRYQSMTEVIVELERCTAGSTTSVTIQQPATTTFENGTFDFLKKPLEEPTILAKPPKRSAPGKTGNGKNKLVLIGAAVLGVMMLAGIIVSLKTKDGTLIVEVDQPDAIVQVLDAEGKVEISQKGGKGTVSISVDPGKHRLKIEKDGFTVFGQDFEIKSGDKKPITAKLVPLEEKPAMVGTKPLFFQTSDFESWAKEVAAMPAEQQVQAVSKKLVELNPGFDGKLTGLRGTGIPTIENGVVTEIGVVATSMADISPVRAFSKLRSFECNGLHRERCTFLDLSPLQGIPLTRLTLLDTAVSDLSPLTGMPLSVLNCARTNVKNISPLADMKLEILVLSETPIDDIELLKHMPLSRLELQGTGVSDLTPLTGLPITHLVVNKTNVSNVSPLRNMPLKILWLDFIPERDTELLGSIKTLEEINGKPTAEFWKEVEDEQSGKKLGFQMAGFDQWVKDVQPIPAEQQVEAVSKKLVELNPGFDGKVTPIISDGVVTKVTFLTDNVSDISPVRALASLNILDCPRVGGDLSNTLADLSPLAGMSLKTLSFNSTAVADLSPLRGMQLSFLNCAATKVADLSPLEGMPLAELYCHRTAVKDLSALRGTPLAILNCEGNTIADPSPLKELPLKSLNLTFVPERDTDLLRSIKTLEIINSKPAAKFWKEVEEQQKGKKPLFFQTPGFDPWAKEVAAMPAEEQIKAVSTKLVELNPGFDGKVTHTVGNGKVTSLQFFTDHVTDISPVRALAGTMWSLACNGTARDKGALSDLSPLQGVLLGNLNCANTQVSDLFPLKDMRLTGLNVADTLVDDLSPLVGHPLAVLEISMSRVGDISPLKGMPLDRLWMGSTFVTDLSPLKGMPLTNLNFDGTHVSDLSSVQHLPLKHLILSFRPDWDTGLLRSVKTLESINMKPAVDFCTAVEAYQTRLKKTLAFRTPEFDQWVKDVASMPAENQVEAVSKKLVELNPDFDGKVTPTIENGMVARIQFMADSVIDISPVRAIVGLKSLNCSASTFIVEGGLASLAPLEGLPLTELVFNYTYVADLTPLRGMKLVKLECYGTRVSDLSPLKDMPLASLSVIHTPISDISALKGMPLSVITMNLTLVTDLSPLRGMPLTWLDCRRSRITDFTPLKDMPLQYCALDFKPERHTELLRSIKTLETINEKPAAEFWKEIEGQN